MEAFVNTRLLEPGGRILVAVSGGADSLALLHALSGLRPVRRVEAVAAHVHHGMRGEEADADAAFLQALCGEWQVPLAVAQADVPALATVRGISVEEAGRIARYEAFGVLAREHGCGTVATAHHADDLAETVLLNLFRGAGIDGLAGIPERRLLNAEAGAPVWVVRPLLHRTRREIEEYCAAHRLQARHDRTNDDLAFRRNRVRQQLMPLLEEYDPHLRRHLVRLAAQAREERNLLRSEAEALLRVALLPHDGAALVLQCRLLAEAPPALARRALRMALEALPGPLFESSAALTERLLELVRGGHTLAFDLPGGGWRARRRGDVLHLEPKPAPAAPGPSPVELASPGVTEAPAFRLRLRIEESPPPSDPRLPPQEAVCDAGALHPPLLFRAPEVGDRFQPLGAPGTRLLSDLFTDRKVPRERRGTWPVVADQRGLVWVVGLAVAERARVGPGTRRCLRFRAETMAPGPREAAPADSSDMV